MVGWHVMLDCHSVADLVAALGALFATGGWAQDEGSVWLAAFSHFGHLHQHGSMYTFLVLSIGMHSHGYIL